MAGLHELARLDLGRLELGVGALALRERLPLRAHRRRSPTTARARARISDSRSSTWRARARAAAASSRSLAYENVHEGRRGRRARRTRSREESVVQGRRPTPCEEGAERSSQLEAALLVREHRRGRSTCASVAPQTSPPRWGSAEARIRTQLEITPLPPRPRRRAPPPSSFSGQRRRRRPAPPPSSSLRGLAPTLCAFAAGPPAGSARALLNAVFSPS